MMKTKLISALLLCLASLPVCAADEANRTVVLVGSHTEKWGFLGVAEGINALCTNGVIYFDISTPLGKSMFGTLLIAKTTGQKVRIGYTVPTSTGLCYLTLAALM